MSSKDNNQMNVSVLHDETFIEPPPELLRTPHCKTFSLESYVETSLFPITDKPNEKQQQLLKVVCSNIEREC